MEYLGIKNGSWILKEKGRTIRVPVKVAEYIMKLGRNIGFSAGVSMSQKYIAHRLESNRKLDRKMKELLQNGPLRYFYHGDGKFRKFQDSEAENLLKEVLSPARKK